MEDQIFLEGLALSPRTDFHIPVVLEALNGVGRSVGRHHHGGVVEDQAGADREAEEPHREFRLHSVPASFDHVLWNPPFAFDHSDRRGDADPLQLDGLTYHAEDLQELASASLLLGQVELPCDELLPLSDSLHLQTGSS